jgi:hypothetical protein
LRQLIVRFPGAEISDRRTPAGLGRLWVIDSKQRADLAEELKALGFYWSSHEFAWYWREC